MKNAGKIFTAVFAVVVCFFTACEDFTGSEEAAYDELQPFSDITGFAEYLAVRNVNTPDNPIPVKININLSVHWQEILDVPYTVRRYVEIDLSESTGLTITGSYPVFSNYSNVYPLSVVLPNTITSIGEYAFFGCTGFTGIILPDSVITIGEHAFYGCSGLNDITIGDNVTSIGYRAFQSCYNLIGINLPDSIIGIGDYAFFNCFGLTDITIPANVTSIGDDVFGYCDSLEAINVVPDNIAYSSIDGVLYNKDFSTLIRWPAGKIETVLIPDSVTTIDIGAIAECIWLTGITIPGNVTGIGDYAFEGCSNLVSVTFESIIAEDDFSEVYTFPGDLRDKYFSVDGGMGTYTRVDENSSTWTKMEL